jgi:hypothetical protein
MLSACIDNRQSLVELMIEKGADEFNRGLRHCCGNYSIAKLMIEKGATDCSELNLLKFVRWFPENDVIPFSKLPHLPTELREALAPKIQRYEQATNELKKELNSLSLIIPDIVNHILVPYLRYQP